MGLKLGERIDATPLKAHRGVYARLQEPIRPESVSGVVTPLARGMARIREETSSRLILEVRWQDGRTARYLLTSDTFERVG